MNSQANVIIIGGGVIGTSIAYHLTKAGCRDIIVLEKNYIGSGSTEKCPGGIRQQFSSEINIRLSMESIEFFKHFEEKTGHSADFHQDGYLILAITEQELKAFRQNVDLQRRIGVEVYPLSPGEAKKILPPLNIEDVLGATYCSTDGYADPYSVVQGFASAARSLGARILEDVEVGGLEIKGGKVRRVLTTKGEFEAPVVINAAGPYAAQIGKMADVDIPIRPSRRHVFVTEPLPDQLNKPNKLGGRNHPMVIDFSNGFWFRREGPALIFGMSNPDEAEGFDTSVDWDFLANSLAEVACHRLPLLGDIGITRGQAGLHSDTPDYHAILGKAPEMEGFYLACGFSGHGFMHSPAVGRLMSELILEERTPSPDIRPLRVERFQEQLFQKEQVFI